MHQYHLFGFLKGQQDNLRYLEAKFLKELNQKKELKILMKNIQVKRKGVTLNKQLLRMSYLNQKWLGFKGQIYIL